MVDSVVAVEVATISSDRLESLLGPASASSVIATPTPSSPIDAASDPPGGTDWVDGGGGVGASSVAGPAADDDASEAIIRSETLRRLALIPLPDRRLIVRAYTMSWREGEIN